MPGKVRGEVRDVQHGEVLVPTIYYPARKTKLLYEEHGWSELKGVCAPAPILNVVDSS